MAEPRATAPPRDAAGLDELAANIAPEPAAKRAQGRRERTRGDNCGAPFGQLLLGAGPGLFFLIFEKFDALLCHTTARVVVVLFAHVRLGIPALAAILVPRFHAGLHVLWICAESPGTHAFCRR